MPLTEAFRDTKHLRISLAYGIELNSQLPRSYPLMLNVYFLNFHKSASVTGMLLELGLHSFCTLRHNAEWSFSETCFYVPQYFASNC